MLFDDFRRCKTHPWSCVSLNKVNLFITIDKLHFHKDENKSPNISFMSYYFDICEAICAQEKSHSFSLVSYFYSFLKEVWLFPSKKFGWRRKEKWEKLKVRYLDFLWIRIQTSVNPLGGIQRIHSIQDILDRHSTAPRICATRQNCAWNEKNHRVLAHIFVVLWHDANRNEK